MKVFLAMALHTIRLNKIKRSIFLVFNGEIIQSNPNLKIAIYIIGFMAKKNYIYLHQNQLGMETLKLFEKYLFYGLSLRVPDPPPDPPDDPPKPPGK
jgi:hypothetical protein